MIVLTSIIEHMAKRRIAHAFQNEAVLLKKEKLDLETHLLGVPQKNHNSYAIIFHLSLFEISVMKD